VAIPTGTIRVYVCQRRTKHGAVVFFLRYNDPYTRRDIRRKLCKTEIHPTSRSLRKWIVWANEAAYRLQQELSQNGETAIYQKTLNMALSEYMVWASEPGGDGAANLAEGTQDFRHRTIQGFIAYCKSRNTPDRLHMIWRTIAAEWRDKLLRDGYNGSTVNAMISAVQSWYEWAFDHGYTDRNPFTHIRRVRLRTKRACVPIQTADDLRKLLAALPAEFVPCIAFLATTGLRAGELRSVQPSDISVEEAILRVRWSAPERSKLHARTIPLCRQALDSVLSQLTLRGPSSGQYLFGAQDGHRPYTTQLNALLLKHGCTPHDLRRFFITALETIGVPARVVDDLAGHAPGKVRAAYTPSQNLEASRPWIEKFSTWLRGNTSGHFASSLSIS
jgi:integrase